MRIENEYIKCGFFWRPDQENNKLPGILKIFDGGEIELEVFGNINDIISFKNKDNPDLILGLVEIDEPITLKICFLSAEPPPITGIIKIKYYAENAFIGTHLEKDKKLTFNTFKFSLDCLYEWINIKGIKHDLNLDSNTLILQYTKPENILINLKNGMMLEVGFGLTQPKPKVSNETRFKEDVCFILKSYELKELDDFINTASKISDFVCFALDEVLSIKNVVATSTKTNKVPNHPLPIKIFYAAKCHAAIMPNIRKKKVIFTYDAIQENAQETINNWLDAYEKISPTINLYFSTKINSKNYIEHKFLSLVQGLESYHSRNNPKQLNLRSRLTCIFDSLNNYLKLENENITNQIDVIVNSRNYLTHFGLNKRDNVTTDLGLIEINDLLKYVYILIFLKEIGFTDFELESIDITKLKPLNKSC